MKFQAIVDLVIFAPNEEEALHAAQDAARCTMHVGGVCATSRNLEEIEDEKDASKS